MHSLSLNIIVNKTFNGQRVEGLLTGTDHRPSKIVDVTNKNKTRQIQLYFSLPTKFIGQFLVGIFNKLQFDHK